MFLHTFYTWILANILHPVMFFLATFVMGEASGLNQNLFESYFLYLIYSFFISIPCLFFRMALPFYNSCYANDR